MFLPGDRKYHVWIRRFVLQPNGILFEEYLLIELMMVERITTICFVEPKESHVGHLGFTRHLPSTKAHIISAQPLGDTN